jgi:hypothetical protein
MRTWHASVSAINVARLMQFGDRGDVAVSLFEERSIPPGHRLIALSEA